MKSASLVYSRIVYNSDASVSILIPTYRTSYPFEECIKSISMQECVEKINVIIILNGEKDGFIENIINVLKKYKNFNVKLFYTKEKGVSLARNIGIKEVQTDFLCFIDDDDWISESYISELLECTNKNCVGLATMLDFKFSNKYFDSYFTSQYEKIKNKKNLSITDVRSWFSVPVIKLIHREMIGNARFCESLSNGEDALFMFDIASNNMIFCFTSEKAIYYRRVTDDGLVATLKKRGRLKQIIHALRLSYLFTKHYINSGFKQNFVFYCTRVLAPFKNILK